MKVAFIGLGIMGKRMARNLLGTASELRVWNRSAAPRTELATAGAIACESAAEAVKGAEIVFTVLSRPEVVQALAWGEKGFLPHMEPGALWVDSTTVNPSFTMEEAAFANQHGVHFLNAPVSGTKPHAEKGELTFIIGGEEKWVEKVRPLLEQMSVKQLHVGPMGAGSKVKILLNGLLAQSMVMFAETMQVGVKMGLDREFLLNLLPNTPVVPAFVNMKVEAMRTGEYETQFPLELMQKDLQLLCQTAYEVQQPLFLANLAKEVYAQANQQGMGRKDFSAIYAYLSEA